MQTIDLYKPDFIIIGAMKAATSAIYEYLMQHPLVTHRLPKELHFFTLNFDQGLDWYLSQFKSVKDNPLNQNLLIGEASPSYLTSKEAPKRIYQLFPEVKIIISLRNPADRAISHYYHQFNRVKDETRPIELAFSQQEIDNLDKQPISKTSSYLHLGRYAHQIKNWLEIFPSEQMLILNYHNLEKDPNHFMSQIYTFLDLENKTINNFQKIYSNQYPAVPYDIKARLMQYFTPCDRELEELIGMRLNNIY